MKKREKKGVGYKVRYTERILPRVLLAKEIEKTSKSPLANLAAVQFCKTFPPVLFVAGDD